MKFSLSSWAITASLLTFTVFPASSFASTEEDNNRMMFYGMGMGMGVLMCDFLLNDMIDRTMAGIYISNMRSELRTESVYTEYPLGPVRSQSVKDGFNAGVKEMSGCSLRF